jgi:O-antigen/teichoic acid export membrane protein
VSRDVEQPDVDEVAEGRRPDEQGLAGAEIRERAAAGIGLDGLRGIANLVFGLGGTIALARMLTPRDFGLVALGLTVLLFGTFLAHGGLAAALIRRSARPARRELEAIQGFQLALTVTAAIVTAAVAWPLGAAGQVTALMVASLPLVVLRTPAIVVLERDLQYRRITVVEVTEIAVYYAFAVVAVAVGGGVWGFAGASVVRAGVGSALMLYVEAGGRVRPRLEWRSIRGIVAFGASYQAVGLAQMFRGQGVNVTIAAVSGIEVLGLWSIAQRVLQFPFLLFSSLWRVSFPAMSRLVAVGENMRPVIERAVAVAAVGTGFLLVPLVGGAPALVPSVMGGRWAESAWILPPAGLGLMFAGPVSVAAVGYLWAVGDARTPLKSVVVSIPAWALVMLPLLPFIGVAAVGLGWLAANVAETSVLARGAARHAGADAISPVVRPTLAGAAAAGAGWILAESSAATLGVGLGAAAVALLVYVGGLGLVCRSQLGELGRVAMRVLRAAIGRAAEQGAAPSA